MIDTYNTYWNELTQSQHRIETYLALDRLRVYCGRLSKPGVSNVFEMKRQVFIF